MNIELSELEQILNYLETTSLEPHDDYVSEFTYKDQKILYKYIKELESQYCNRTDCSGRIKDSKKYNSLQQIIDKATEYNNYLKEHCKYRLNDGHLRKMGKILAGDYNE